jgi:hypothetical protein
MMGDKNMKKLILIPFLILCLFFINSYSMAQSETYDAEIRQGIAKDVMNRLIAFVESPDNDFVVPYSDSHYKPLMDKMASIVSKYNENVIFKEKFKILAVDIQMAGNKINGRVEWVFVNLRFINEDWLLRIRVKSKEERDI